MSSTRTSVGRESFYDSLNDDSFDGVDEHRALALEQAKFIDRNELTNLAAHAFFGLSVAYVFWQEGTFRHIWIWAAVLGAVLLARVGVHFLADATRAPRRWLNVQIMAAVLSGAVWGSLSLFLDAESCPENDALLLFILSGLAAGAVSSSSGYLPAVMAFVLPALLPLCVHAYMVGDKPHAVLGAVVPVAIIFFIRLAQHSRDTLRSATRFQIQNADLVSDLRNAAESAQRNEAKFRDLVEGSVQGILILIDGRVVYVNASAEEMLGESKGAIQGRPVTDLMTVPEDILKTGTRGGGPLDVQADLDGGRRWLEMVSRRIEWNGRPAIELSFMDVTEQREASQAVAKSEEHYRTLFEAIQDGIIVGDGETEFAEVNQAFIDMIGYSAEELREMSHTDITPPSCHEDGRLARKQNQERGFTDEFEREYIRKDGTRFPGRMRGWKMKTPEGELPRFLVIVQDITEQREATQAIQKSEERYRTLFETIKEGIVVGTFRRPFVDVNQAFCAMVGYTKEELYDLDLTDLVAKPDMPVLERVARELRQAGSAQEFNFTLCRQDGSTFPAVGRGWRMSITDDGDVEGLIIVRDVTERKQQEEMLRQAQKMEAVGQLTGGVAHDFNNLLAIIQGNLELIDEGLEGEAGLQSYAETALRAAQRGSALTQRLLAFSRKQVLAPRLLDINEVLDDVLGLMKRAVKGSAEIVTECADNLWPTLIDRAQLETALLNLAVNARDAMDEGGLLAIRTANRTIEDEVMTADGPIDPGDYVELTVSDNGRGMSEEVRAQAFEPFFTTKRIGEGSGLGLSMIYGFVKQSGGFVVLESSPGAGTTVTLYLPRAEEPAEAPGAQTVDDDAGEVRGHNEVVLVVDDERDVRDVVKRHLSSLGYRALIAGSAREALERLESEVGIDVLFTDVVLPGEMSGFSLAERAKKLRPGISILFTSGFADCSPRYGAKELTDVPVLEKPYSKARLARELRRLLD